MPFTEEEKDEIISRYKDGESPADMAADFGKSRGAVKEFLRKQGVIRSQSESAKLASEKGKKKKWIAAMVTSAKTTNRFHPGKRFSGPKACEICDESYIATSAHQKWCPTCCPGQAWRALIQRYGITKPLWDKLLASQGGLCKLCERPASVVDHCHETGRVRGLLCNACNRSMAAVDDREWLARAEVYRADAK